MHLNFEVVLVQQYFPIFIHIKTFKIQFWNVTFYPVQSINIAICLRLVFSQGTRQQLCPGSPEIKLQNGLVS